MSVNWSGLAGEDLQDVPEFLNDSELLGGIVGSKHDHHTAPYSLTEEFVAVYRMHPLMPDDYRVSLAGDRSPARESHAARDRRRPHTVDCRTADHARLVLLIRHCHPGAITLHNYPRHLQNLTRDDGEHLDLAAVDIFRDRERGVPRYNQFRRLMHKDPVNSFDRAHRQPGMAQADRGSTTAISRVST